MFGKSRLHFAYLHFPLFQLPLQKAYGLRTHILLCSTNTHDQSQYPADLARSLQDHVFRVEAE